MAAKGDPKFRAPAAQRGRVVALFGNRRLDGAVIARRSPTATAAASYPPNVEVLNAHRRAGPRRRSS
jgi:hypothetical protein